MKKHDILPRWIIPFYSEDVIRFKVTEESNKQLDPNNVNQYITLNLTPNGFALPDGIYSGALEYAISSVFDIIDSATGSHFANDKKTEHIYASIDFSPDFFYDRHSDAIDIAEARQRIKAIYISGTGYRIYRINRHILFELWHR